MWPIRKLRPLLLVDLLIVVVSAGLWGQASPMQLPSTALLVQEKTFLNYSEDFLEFAKGHKEEDLEWEATMGLQLAASDTAELLGSASTTAQIYETLECSADRAAVLPIVTFQLQFYMKQVEHTIGATNNSLAYVKTPATAQLGLQMTVELGHVKETLESALKNLR